jgi:nitrite reductase (cytochrome c-552)
MSDKPADPAPPNPRARRRRILWIALTVAGFVASAAVGAMLVSITRHKTEAKTTFVRLVEVGEDDTDPAKWGTNWPLQYDGYKRTAIKTTTRYGGHGGSEAMPEEKIERDPWLKRMFLGYAFSIDYRDRRGHAYMLVDQQSTDRLSKPQSGSCLHCHASVMPLYRKLGNGDVFAGMDATHKLTYQETAAQLAATGGAHPVSCVDCHDPKTMALRVTRPGFLRGIAALAASDAPVPAFTSIAEWRKAGKKGTYDPNAEATRGEMRSFVCGQCHVEYYCSSKQPLTFPWGNGLAVEAIEAFWDQTKFPDGATFFDYKHKETDAPILKAQHPEFELWSQGVHARSGVSCADCHMPYARMGATKISDHWVRSPLLNVNRACQTCHRVSEGELTSRVAVIQDRNHALLQRGGAAIVDLIDTIVAAKAAGATPEQLAPALALQRKAQWRLDFIAAENSMGFHAPQEAARILGEALDDARQGQLAARALLPAGAVLPAAPPAAPAAPATPAPGAPAAPAPAPAAPTTPAPPAPAPH